MGSFLIASALGFTVYQLAVWVFISDDRLFFKIGRSVVNLTPEDAAWLRRIFAVLLIGFGLSFGMWLHRPFLSPDELRGGAVILGFFYGPLLAIWINTLLAKPVNEPLSIGQNIAGVGLALLFLVGSVGNPTGELIQRYARNINKIGFGGAELVFSQKSAQANPLGGSLPLSGEPPTFASSTGEIGLAYLDSIDSMIRDRDYLKLFRSIGESKQSSAGQSSHGRRMLEDRKAAGVYYVLSNLLRAGSFAERTIKKPADCMVGWYSVTGDTASINRHLAGFADVFRQLPTVESDHRIDELAKKFVEQSFSIGADAVASIPSALLAEKCDSLLEVFCPDAFTKKNKPRLDYLGRKRALPETERDDARLEACVKQIEADPKQHPALARLRSEIEPYVAGFVKERGWDERPYFALGYASILSQLGQRQAASALLDSWIHTRAVRPIRWKLAADWFDVRSRSILANFLEDWITKEGQAAPIALRDEHIANLDFVRSDLRGRLSEVDFFREISLRARSAGGLSDALKEPGACKSNDPHSDLWQRLFETYVTAELTYLNALLDHPRYAEEYSERAMMVATTQLVGLDLSCIPRIPDQETDFAYPRAKTYYALVLDAVGRNAFEYSATHWSSEGDEVRRVRLADALQVVHFGLNLIGEIAAKERNRNGAPFLRRIEPSDAVEAEDKLKRTEKKLMSINDYMEQ
jgi:hypothetical protein